MATLNDEHLRALRFLARHPGGCTEEALLAQGFTAGELGWLVYSGFAKLRRGGGHTSAKVLRVKITEAGQKAIAEQKRLVLSVRPKTC
jgi:hypothetical protein